MNFAVLPLYKSMNKIKFLDMSDPVKHLEINLNNWTQSIENKEKEKKKLATKDSTAI